MPKETFYHLNDKKREKVEKALENEFGRTTFEKASISRIVEEAGIPRGSFYQYFEDKEDAIHYIVEKYILLEKEAMKKNLEETQGNIFEASLKIFDYITSKTHDGLKAKFYKNIMQELKKNNTNLLSKMEEINQFVDSSILNIKEAKDLKNIIKIISIVTRTAAIHVHSGKITLEEAREELKNQIEILKKGMLK